MHRLWNMFLTRQGSTACVALAALLPMLIIGCEPATKPEYFRVVELHGTPYERGLQHGRLFPSEIRSLYTQILTASILPYLNRERADIAAVLTEYQGADYDNGQFSYQLMLQAAQGIEPDLPEEYVEEMHGIADGAGLPYEEILIFNTFVETMLSLRAITFFIRDMGAPYVASIAWDGGLDADGVDNDGDGEVDEEGEGALEPYDPSPRASMVEVPVDAIFRFVLIDQAGAGEILGAGEEEALPEGVDPETVRIQLDTEIFEAGDPSISTRPISCDLGDGLEVSFSPPGGLERASVHALVLQAGDRAMVTTTPPPHANFMRDERVVFTTEGYGEPPRAVDNRGERDDRTQPSSIAFAARASATTMNEPLMANHFAVLDVDASHKHTALFVHHVDEGLDHVVLGWTGMIGGFSGMNSEGLSYSITPSDSLDISMVNDILANIINLERARLICTGIPAGIIGRGIISGAGDVDEASTWLESSTRSFAWNVLLADRSGDMRAVELDSAILGDGGVYAYGPASGDERHAIASVGPDDLRIASHFVSNTEDMSFIFIRPQRYWSRYYYRSLRAFYTLGDRIDGVYGQLDVDTMIDIMRDPDLVDPHDSMSAVVFEPAAGRLHVAMGQVPATDGEFISFELADFFGEGGSP